MTTHLIKQCVKNSFINCEMTNMRALIFLVAEMLIFIQMVMESLRVVFIATPDFLKHLIYPLDTRAQAMFHVLLTESQFIL